MRFAHAHVQDRRSVELAVRVFKKDGCVLCKVSEADLERYGWGLDPAGAVERYRETRNQEAVEDGRQDWNSTLIEVTDDEEAGLPTRRFRFSGELAVDTTRPEKALRMMAQILLDAANGVTTGFDHEAKGEVTQE